MCSIMRLFFLETISVLADDMGNWKGPKFLRDTNHLKGKGGIE